MTSTDYENPYRPLPVRVFNLIGRAGRNSGRCLEIDPLIDYARRKTGLTDFGEDGHLRALAVLVESINDEARLTATGRLIQKSRLAAALVHRLRIEDLLRRNPEIHDIDLGTIVLITGLQRTGTTLLQRLLNSHPGVRGVSGTEALDPVSAANLKKRGQKARKLRAVLAKRAISYLAPQFMAIHPIEPEEPEEDVMLPDADHRVERRVVVGNEVEHGVLAGAGERRPERVPDGGRRSEAQEDERRGPPHRSDNLPVGIDGRERPPSGGWHGCAHANPPRCRSGHADRGGRSRFVPSSSGPAGRWCGRTATAMQPTT